MKKPSGETTRYRQVLLTLLLLAIAFVGGQRYGAYTEAARPSDPADAPSELGVYICGAVRQPGVYWLPVDARVSDAVDAAGAMADADLEQMDLAAPLQDGVTLRVPSRNEAAAVPDRMAPETLSLTDSLDLNTATAAELETLPGIGPEKAAAIVEYRQQNGPFLVVDQLLNVPGIGSATLEKIRDAVCAE